MCIEDSFIMSALLKEVNDIKGLEKAFATFDEVRRERTQKNVKTSQEAGMMYDMELYGDDLDKIEKDFTSRQNWIWDIDLPAEIERARKIYHGTGSHI